MLVYSSGLYGSNEILKNWNFSCRKNDLNDFTDLLLPYFHVVRTKELNKKQILKHLSEAFYDVIVDGLFGKQLHNIKKNLI